MGGMLFNKLPEDIFKPLSGPNRHLYEKVLLRIYPVFFDEETASADYPQRETASLLHEHGKDPKKILDRKALGRVEGELKELAQALLQAVPAKVLEQENIDPASPVSSDTKRVGLWGRTKLTD